VMGSEEDGFRRLAASGGSTVMGSDEDGFRRLAASGGLCVRLARSLTLHAPRSRA
jgi:hypothetical protein